MKGRGKGKPWFPLKEGGWGETLVSPTWVSLEGRGLGGNLGFPYLGFPYNLNLITLGSSPYIKSCLCAATSLCTNLDISNTSVSTIIVSYFNNRIF